MEITRSINIFVSEHQVKQGDSNNEDKYLDVLNKFIQGRSNDNSNTNVHQVCQPSANIFPLISFYTLEPAPVSSLDLYNFNINTNMISLTTAIPRDSDLH